MDEDSNADGLPAQIYDLLFKHLMRLSGKAIINFINGLFGTNYPPDSTLAYPATESVGAGLRRLLADMIIVVNGIDAYHLEAQIDDDGAIALRVFQYAYAYAEQTRTTVGGTVTLKFPASQVLYFESTKATPARIRLRLEFPDGGWYIYEVPAFKVLEYSLEELSDRKLAPLFPFYILKLRRQMQAAKTGEQRQAVAEEAKALVSRLFALTGQHEKAGDVEKADAKKILDALDMLYTKVYGGYEEMQEAGVMVRDEIKFYSDYLIEEAVKEKDRVIAEKDRIIAEKNRKIAELTGLPLETVMAL